jgi:hypothetical protein
MTEGDQTFEGMERTTKFSFTGMGYESLKVDFQRGDEVEFKVRGKVKMIGDEDMQNGPIHLIKVAVDSVSPVSFEEPADPAVAVLDGDGTLLEEGTD